MPSNSWEEFDADFQACWESAFESACGAVLAVTMTAVRHDLNGPSLGGDGCGVKVTIELQSSSLQTPLTLAVCKADGLLAGSLQKLPCPALLQQPLVVVVELSCRTVLSPTCILVCINCLSLVAWAAQLCFACKLFIFCPWQSCRPGCCEGCRLAPDVAAACHVACHDFGCVRLDLADQEAPG